MGNGLFRDLAKKEHRMIHILFFADPNSIHDIKWMSWFSSKSNYKCFLVSRTIHPLPQNIKNIIFLGHLNDFSVFKPWKNQKDKKRLNQWMKNYQIDLVHVYFAEPNLLWSKVIDKKIPVVLTTRGSDVLVSLKQFIKSPQWSQTYLAKVYKNRLNQCQAIISTSSKQKRFLIEKYRVNTPIYVVRTGVDIGRFIENIGDRNVIFFPRNMKPLYQHELALQAIQLLPKEVRLSYEFVFINKDSSDKEYVKQITQLINQTAAKIHFLDSLNPDEYFKMLSQSKVVVMTPKSDGAPVSGMEAIASGANLVMPNIGYDQDLFEKALFYQPQNVENLRLKIMEALSNNMFVNLGDYKEKVDRDVQMKKVEAIYRQLLANEK